MKRVLRQRCQSERFSRESYGFSLFWLTYGRTDLEKKKKLNYFVLYNFFIFTTHDLHELSIKMAFVACTLYHSNYGTVYRQVGENWDKANQVLSHTLWGS